MMLRPKSLPSDARIGIFSPSEPVGHQRKDRVQGGIAILEDKGFTCRPATNWLAQSAYTAGSITDRVNDLHQLLADDSVHALLSSWGGKSCNQLVTHIDLALMAEARKPIFAFSDGCVLLNLATGQTGLTTFYGPNVLGKLHETRHADLAIARGHRLSSDVLGDPTSEDRVLRSGVGEGRLFGGNLSTFALGAAALPSLSDLWNEGIFFWEELSMPAQLIDQFLTSLRNLGLFRRLNGMVIGKFVAEDPQEWKRADSFRVVEAVLNGCNFPVYYRPSFGHGKLENPILPIGARCRLDTSEGTLRLLEPVVE